MTERSIPASALVLLASAVLLAVAAVGFGWSAGEASAEIGRAAGRACNNAYQLPPWVYWQGWSGTLLATASVLVVLTARALVLEQVGILRSILPALIAVPILVYGVDALTDDGRTHAIGIVASVLIVGMTIGLHPLTRNRVPTRFGWLVPVVLTFAVLALLIALTGLDSVFVNAPNGLPVCFG